MQYSLTKFNATQPILDNGTAKSASCETMGSGDIVTQLISLAKQFKAGTLKADAPNPSLISLDGDIYLNQSSSSIAIEHLNQLASIQYNIQLAIAGTGCWDSASG